MTPFYCYLVILHNIAIAQQCYLLIKHPVFPDTIYVYGVVTAYEQAGAPAKSNPPVVYTPVSQKQAPLIWH
jgi:hypothetical protein